MIRRSVLVLGAVLALASLSSCTTFTRSDTAARIGGDDLTTSELDGLTKSDNSGDAVRGVMTKWLILGMLGGDTTGLTDSTELSTRLQAAELQLASPFLPEAKTAYEKGLDGSPILCLRVVPLGTDVKPDTVLAELAAGTTFANVAAKYSTDSTLASNGGIFADTQGNECASPDSFNATLMGFIKTAGAKVGTPVNITDGTSNAIVLLRPFDDLTLSDQARPVIEKVSVEVKSRLDKATIFVNPRYGTWDATNAAVVALAT